MEDKEIYCAYMDNTEAFVGTKEEIVEWAFDEQFYLMDLEIYKLGDKVSFKVDIQIT